MASFLETTVDKFIFKVATDRLYSPSGIWAWDQGNGRVRLGMTDYQQQLGGDVAFVHLKAPGTRLDADAEFAEVETIKATLSLLAPVPGTVVETNGQLASTPEMVNQDPYGQGWLAVLEAVNWQAERTQLLAPEAYLAVMLSQAREELQS
jgi:glycine cleavage system H protein